MRSCLAMVWLNRDLTVSAVNECKTGAAFVIAFTFGSANTRFDARKAALLDDVTAIQAAYLRANLIPEPHRTTVRSLLRDYVQARAGIVYAYGQPDTLQLVQQRAAFLQELMWSHVEEMAEEHGETRVNVLFTRALNDVFKLHTKRVVLGAYYRIPSAMWLSLMFASGVAMFAVGLQFGIGGNRRVHAATGDHICASDGARAAGGRSGSG